MAYEDLFSEGMIEQGNIDLDNRPKVDMGDGKYATVRSISVGFGDKTYLIPTVHEDGYIMDEEEAIKHFKKTGKHLGAFDSPTTADEYGVNLSKRQGEHYDDKGPTLDDVGLDIPDVNVKESDIEKASQVDRELAEGMLGGESPYLKSIKEKEDAQYNAVGRVWKPAVEEAIKKRSKGGLSELFSR